MFGTLIFWVFTGAFRYRRVGQKSNRTVSETLSFLVLSLSVHWHCWSCSTTSGPGCLARTCFSSTYSFSFSWAERMFARREKTKTHCDTQSTRAPSTRASSVQQTSTSTTHKHLECLQTPSKTPSSHAVSLTGVMWLTWWNLLLSFSSSYSNIRTNWSDDWLTDQSFCDILCQLLVWTENETAGRWFAQASRVINALWLLGTSRCLQRKNPDYTIFYNN